MILVVLEKIWENAQPLQFQQKKKLKDLVKGEKNSKQKSYPKNCNWLIM